MWTDNRRTGLTGTITGNNFDGLSGDNIDNLGAFKKEITFDEQKFKRFIGQCRTTNPTTSVVPTINKKKLLI